MNFPILYYIRALFLAAIFPVFLTLGYYYLRGDWPDSVEAAGMFVIYSSYVSFCGLIDAVIIPPFIKKLKIFWWYFWTSLTFGLLAVALGLTGSLFYAQIALICLLANICLGLAAVFVHEGFFVKAKVISSFYTTIFLMLGLIFIGHTYSELSIANIIKGITLIFYPGVGEGY